MFGGGDGNLSDTSDAPSNISNISEALNGRGHLVSQNLNLSVTSNSSVGEDPKTQEIRRLREENSRLKRRLQAILGDSEEDARKDWSELSKKRKKQLLSNISTQMGKLAEKRGNGIVNIAASLIAVARGRCNSATTFMYMCIYVCL